MRVQRQATATHAMWQVQAIRSANVRANAIVLNSALSAYARNRPPLRTPARQCCVSCNARAFGPPRSPTASSRHYVVIRRLRQHNGEIAGGSAPTAGQPWVLVLFVRGFRSKHSALAFEYAWQKPHSSRHTARMWGVLGMSKCSVRTSVSVRRRALSMLLGHGVLGHEPLSVCEVA